MSDYKEPKGVDNPEQTTEAEDRLKKQKKKEKRRVRWRNALIIALIVIIILLLLRRCGPEIKAPEPIQKWFNTLVDPNAGDPIQKDDQEEIDRLNQQLLASLITYSINKSPVFPSGTAEGNLNIINPEDNTYPQVVEIYMTDENGDATNEMIYQSGLIPVGKTVKTAKLSTDLDAGTYRVMAIIYSVDEETGAELNSLNTPLTLTVNS